MNEDVWYPRFGIIWNASPWFCSKLMLYVACVPFNKKKNEFKKKNSKISNFYSITRSRSCTNSSESNTSVKYDCSLIVIPVLSTKLMIGSLSFISSIIINAVLLTMEVTSLHSYAII